MRLDAVVETSRRVAAASGRREKTGHLADCIGAASAAAVPLVVAYLSGDPGRPSLGIGHAALRDARPGTAAAMPTLTVAAVDAALTRIGATKGKGSAAERRRLLSALLAQATPAEQDFLVRLLIGELRQGAEEGLVVEAVARAADVPLARLRHAVMVAGDVPAVAGVALAAGAAGLDRFGIQLFRPVKPMLAQPAADIAEALGRLAVAAIEFKLDGARVQVHKRGRDVAVYSRRLNDVTASVPELVETVAALPVNEAILDGEVLALRPDGRPRPFQVMMRRFGRKLDVAAMRTELPLTPYFFDCLSLDGRDLVGEAATARFAALASILPDALIIPRIETDHAGAAQVFRDMAMAAGHEGVMAKALDAVYAAGGRGRDWLKVKPVETLDLVVLAAEWGHGRRRGWLSNLHLGARDPDGGGFAMLGKTFKGMTDAMLEWQTGHLQTLAIAGDRRVVQVRPELVVEVAFNEIQTSPHYPSGMALRFARVKRYRTDKRAADADTLATVRAIHARRAGVVTET